MVHLAILIFADMIRLFFSLFLLHCSLFTVVAQPGITWAKCFGGHETEIARQIVQTTDGGYLVLGSTTSWDGDVVGLHDSVANFQDFWLLKLDASGGIVWKKCIGGSEKDFPTGIIKTKDGGYALCGYTWSTDRDAAGNINFYSADFWVLKYSATDTLQWQHTYGGYQDDKAFSIAETTDGGYVVAGNTASPDGFVTGLHGMTDFWLVKIDSVGALKWQKCFGGSANETANAVVQTSDGGFVLCGSTNSSDSEVTGTRIDISGRNSWDIWVVKTDTVGHLEWEKTYGGSQNDYGYSITQNKDGGYTLFGKTDFGRNDSGYYFYDDYWLIKVDSAGTVLWQQGYGGSYYDEATTMTPCKDGGYLLAGNTWSDDREVSGNHGGFDAWLVKIDSIGKVEWKQCYGGTKDEVPYGVIETNDGGYAFVGSTNSYDGDVSGLHGNCYYDAAQNDSVCTTDFWVVKLDKFVPEAKLVTPVHTSVYVFPNPFDDTATLLFRLDSLPANCSLSICDALGKEVRSVAIAGDSNTIRIYREGLQKGIYVCTVMQNNKEIIAVAKLVIE